MCQASLWKASSCCFFLSVNWLESYLQEITDTNVATAFRKYNVCKMVRYEDIYKHEFLYVPRKEAFLWVEKNVHSCEGNTVLPEFTF